MSSITLIPKPNKKNTKNELCSGMLEPVHTGLKEPIVYISSMSVAQNLLRQEYLYHGNWQKLKVRTFSEEFVVKYLPSFH